MQENLLNINHQEMYNIKYDLDMAIRKAVSSVDKPGETATVTLKIDMMLVEQFEDRGGVEIAPMFYSCTVTKKSELMREKNATPGLYVWEDDLGALNAVSTDQQVSVFDMEGTGDD
jgi:hypothetical protein